MLIGTGHPNHGGIGPTHYAFLSENSRPAWMLVSQNVFDSGRRGGWKKIVWIPTVEHMLEDGILMMAIHVLRDKDVLSNAKKSFKTANLNRVELYEDIESEALIKLYEQCRSIKILFKIVLTVLEGSTIMRQVGILEKYSMDVEVCVPKYYRAYTHWGDETIIKGSLFDTEQI
jgi:hypothetical protein